MVSHARVVMRFMWLRGFGGRLGRFGRDRSAVSAIEFALVLPLMVSLYVGTYESSQLVSVYRRVGQVTNTVGDLVAQSTSTNATDMSNIFDASTALMQPFATTSLKMTVSSVLYTTDKKLKVSWSKTRNGSAWTTGVEPPVTIPPDLLVTGQEVIVSVASFTYTSAFTNFTADLWGKDHIDMEETAFFRPRLSSTIPFN